MSVKERAKRKLERDAREIVAALQDPDTVEIMVNADGRIWQEKLGQRFPVSAIFKPHRLKRSSRP